MKNRFAAFVEFVLLTAACIGLVAFIGAPGEEQQPARRMRSPASHRLSQGLQAWDENLVLPRQSDRVASYTMNVKLDTQTDIISGWEVLEWRNTTGRYQSEFPFHLYHNAWKNNRSTFAKEAGWQLSRPDMQDRDYGYTNVKKVSLLTPRGDVDITNTFRYIQPDDGNTDDQTVFQISTPRAVAPGGTLRLRIEFETKQPIPISRTGAIRDYHFVVQWFPKIGVWWKPRGGEAAWNCHQFHATTEFFADYGVYNVTMTLPANYVVGATGGIPREEKENNDGTKTYRFIQEDVHDFAWVTAPDLVRNVRTFVHKEAETDEQPGRHHPLREVKVILLTQSHHDNLIERYFDATFKALRYYGEWYGEYPYETVTVVDPANDSRSGGMEYPTLFTGGGNMFAPRETSSPEGVTVHEFGHQFWFGLVGNNEFEEAWLDEGFNSYSTDRVLYTAWPPFKPARYFFGGRGAGSFVGVPYVFDEISLGRYSTGNLELRSQGENDVMARRGWEYYPEYYQETIDTPRVSFRTYGLNSYTKPAMSLYMLENYLGEETMYRVMRTYHHRHRFRHPTSQDFINTVNEVSGKNMNWLFENTWFSSNLFDYSVQPIVNRRLPAPTGLFNANGRPTERKPESYAYECAVVIKREGEATAPVDVLVTFEDGKQKREEWDGQYRWKKFVYYSDVPVKEAVVDPDGKLVMDINYNNNSRVVREPSFRSMAARKLASKWMFWVQNYLEVATFWH